MKVLVHAASILIALGLLFSPIQFDRVGAQAEPPELGWQPVAAGIDYLELHLQDPNQVFVARMDRHNPNTILDSALAHGSLTQGAETVSQLAKRYDQAINPWDSSWGSRNNVVVAVNGSFFNMSTGVPQGGQIISGWYMKRFGDLGGNSGFAYKMDRSVFIGRCVNHRPEKQIIHLPNGTSVTFDGINIPRGQDQLILYTPQYAPTTGTDNNGLEILVEMTRSVSIFPDPSSIEGTVRQVRDGAGNTPLYFDSVVLSASGGARDQLLPLVKAGATISISQEITSYDFDCKTPETFSWSKTYASVNGSFAFLSDGQLSHSDDPGALARHPRTAIAYNDDYIYYIVVDGRDPEHSIGMTIDELAAFAKDTLGATWGIAQDGGGSSTMIVNGVVKNNPAVPCYRVYIPLSTMNSQGVPPPYDPMKDHNRKLSPVTTCQRPVANGMMMIVVEAPQFSAQYQAGDRVLAVEPADVYLGPGNNYAALTSVPAYVTGQVISDMNHLNGVFAKGSHWWQVDFNGIVGWVSDNSLVKYYPVTPLQQLYPR